MLLISIEFAFAILPAGILSFVTIGKLSHNCYLACCANRGPSCAQPCCDALQIPEPQGECLPLRNPTAKMPIARITADDRAGRAPTSPALQRNPYKVCRQSASDPYPHEQKIGWSEVMCAFVPCWVSGQNISSFGYNGAAMLLVNSKRRRKGNS